MLRAMAHVVPSHLMDPKLYPFATAVAHGRADADGDKAFDADERCAPRGAVTAATIAMPPPRRSTGGGLIDQ